MSWSWCGNLSCLQWFRTANDAERFERAYHLLNEHLAREGFSVTYPSVAYGANWSSSLQPLGVIRAAWRRNSSNSEDIIALGLSQDDERFDYQAWVGTSDPNRASRLMTDLNRINDSLLHQMQAQQVQDKNRKLAKDHRTSVKDMLPWGAFPIIADVGAGVLPTYFKGASPLLTDLLPLILVITLAITIVFFCFVGYYALLLAITEGRIRRTK